MTFSASTAWAESGAHWQRDSFASKAVNPDGANGLFFGNPKQFLIQLAAVGVTVAYSFVVSYIIFKVVNLVIKVRVPEKDETMGLDLTQHHENAYTVME